MKKSSLTRLGVGAATVALLLTTVVGNTGSTAASTKGGTLYILQTEDEFLHLDPQRNYTGEDMAFASAYLYRPLTNYTVSSNAKLANTIVNDGASGVTKSNANKTWKFVIRKGMKWEDGSAVTCADYAYGISRTFAINDITDGPLYALSYLDIPADANSDNGTQYPGPYEATAAQQALFNNAVKCTTLRGTETLTIKLNQSVADFNGTTTLSAFAAVKQSFDTGTTYDKNLKSYGPYKIQSYVTGDKMVLVRNPYFDAATDKTRPAYPDVIEVDFSLTGQAITERLMADNGDDKTAIAVGLYPTYVSEIMSGSQYAGRRIVGYDPYVTYVAINTSHITSQAKRRAIMAAYPREQLRQMAGGDFAGSHADGVIKPTMGLDYKPTNVWGYNTFRTTKAAVLARNVGGGVYKCGTTVRSKGYVCTPAVVVTTPHPGLLGYVVPPEGSCEIAQAILSDANISNPGTITYDYRNYDNNPITEGAVAAVKSALECAGFSVNLNKITSRYYSKVLDPATQNDMSGAGWGPDWANASTVIPPLFTPNGGFDLSRYDNATFQAAIATALANGSRTSQARQWQQLNIDAMSAGLVVPRLFTSTQSLVGSNVKNAFLWAPYGSFPYAAIAVQ